MSLLQDSLEAFGQGLDAGFAQHAEVVAGDGLGAEARTGQFGPAFFAFRI